MRSNIAQTLTRAPGQRLDVRDPSGNRIQAVQYDEIQFTRTDRVFGGMGLELGKTERALGEQSEGSRRLAKSALSSRP
jgi:hypothetical protein